MCKDDCLTELNLCAEEVSISNYAYILQFFILEDSLHLSLKGELLLSHRGHFKKVSLSFLCNSLYLRPPMCLNLTEWACSTCSDSLGCR